MSTKLLRPLQLLPTMKTNIIILILSLFLLPLLAPCKEKQVYIVRLVGHSEEKALHEIEDTHHSYLLSVKKNEEEARAARLYSYQHSINGFAAELTPDEASKLSEFEEVVLVYKSEPRKYALQTTRSWEFVGLNKGGRHNLNEFKKGEDLLWKSGYGQEVVVGVLDSGIWPESKSFSDEGMGPVPKSWKGICQTGVAFDSSHCNKKIIGARYYLKGYEHEYGRLNDTIDYRSPRDKDGHGTHTASTVAGRRVSNVSLFGLAGGTASGGAPLARLAIYKACWALPDAEKIMGNTCFEEDMLAAIDDAIRDGVGVLSISIGSLSPLPFAQDAIALGALSAVKKKIVVACAAGNDGPAPGTLSNSEPWVITVGASSLDRDFFRPLVLGNGLKIMGHSATHYTLKKQQPLVYAGDVVVPGVVAQNESAQCLPGSLAPEKVKGKIVLCMRGSGLRIPKGVEVKRAGGAGLILGNNPAKGDEATYDIHVLPATAVSSDNAIKIMEYIKSSKTPMASIKPVKTLYSQPAPFMAGFSSRGPNPIDPNILKPDITAPGVNILAAWSEGDSVTKYSFDKRIVKYNLDSGTSMATPHVAATAALLKAVHPDWSSAAIRSAIMTSASLKNNKRSRITDYDGKIATPFMFGSGHLSPTKAADPGLVYDASHEDYLLYLCSIGTTKVDPAFACPKRPISAANLNYPSLAIPNLNGTVVVNRTVTNVGGGGKSVYFFSAKPPMGVSVKASPGVLLFNRVGQRKSFILTVSARGGIASEDLKNKYGFGWYTWKDGLHKVRSPMAISLA